MTINEIAAAILADLSAAFVVAERPFDRRYVSDGSVLWDWTALLAVEWEATEPAYVTDASEGGLGSPSMMGGGFLPLRSMFSIHAMRDSPYPDEGGTPPQGAKVELSASVVHADAKLVIDTLLARLSDRTLLGDCGRVDFIRQAVVGPDAGVVGSVTSIWVYL